MQSLSYGILISMTLLELLQVPIPEKAEGLLQCIPPVSLTEEGEPQACGKKQASWAKCLWQWKPSYWCHPPMLVYLSREEAVHTSSGNKMYPKPGCLFRQTPFVGVTQPIPCHVSWCREKCQSWLGTENPSHLSLTELPTDPLAHGAGLPGTLDVLSFDTQKEGAS